MQEKPKRNLDFDILRVLSAFAVVMLHVSSAYIESSAVGSVDFYCANFLDSLTRFAVPMFVMISGAIFLNPQKEISVKKLWLGNILRILIIFAVWSYAYYAYQSIYHWGFDFLHQGIVRTILGCVYASNHFWFLFMIIGLYALVPLLRSFVKSAGKKEFDYFVILFFVFQILRITGTILIDKSLTDKLSEMFTIVELSGYLGYFMIGHILMQYGLSKKMKVVIYVVALLGLAGNVGVSNVLSVRQGGYTPGIYDSFGVFTFAQAVALFVFVMDVFGKGNTGKGSGKLLSGLALDTLGIYVMHVALLDYFRSEEFIIGSMRAVPGTLLLTLICFGICALVAALLRRIPIVGKYLC